MVVGLWLSRLLDCGCRTVADWWLLWSLIGGCRGHGLWLLQLLDCDCHGHWIVAVMVVGLWLLQSLDCGCCGYWIVAVAVVGLWLSGSLDCGCHAVADWWLSCSH